MIVDSQNQKLYDLGEARIVKELIIPKFPSVEGHIVGIGDDCAVIPVPSSDYALAMTIDPCPTPVVCLIEPPDLYHYGWLTILINVSDLAAMGAKPMGIQISTVMPEDMAVTDYERFLDGLADASREWICPVIGGNIKDGPEFTATGSALGAVKVNCVMRRQGTKPGDRVCVIGEMGLFWAAVLTRLVPDTHLDTSHQGFLDNALYRPVARILEGVALAESQLATACMDSSDGVIGCLRELASLNQVDIILNDTSLRPHSAVQQVSTLAGIDARKLMLSWGNWELVCTVSPENYEKAKVLIESLGTPFADIGEACKGTGKVLIEQESRLGLLANFASERFCATSFFTHGLNSYVDLLRNTPLLQT